MRFTARVIRRWDLMQNKIKNIEQLTDDKLLTEARLILKKEIADKLKKRMIENASYRVYQVDNPDNLMTLGRSRFNQWMFKNVTTYKKFIKQFVSKKTVFDTGRKPYSRVEPNPPIDPSLLNIQTGDLVSKFYVRVLKESKCINMYVGNSSPHFYQIAITMDANYSGKMMERPYIDNIRAEYNKIVNRRWPVFKEAFRDKVYK